MRFGTQDKDFFPKDFTEKFKVIRDMGFEAFEVDGKTLVENTDSLLEVSEKTGIKIVSACGGYRGWIGDFIEEKRVFAIEDLKIIIKALGKTKGVGVVVPAAWGMFTFRLPPMVSPRTAQGDRKAILSSLAELDVTAGENGVFVLLEPLNRYQDHMLNTVADARSIIEEGSFKNVKITADFYHMNIEEDDVSKTIRNNNAFIRHIHVADNHKYQPGTGSIDFKKHFAVLKEVGYEGYIVYEGRVRGDNPLAEYRKSIDFLRNCV